MQAVPMMLMASAAAPAVTSLAADAAFSSALAGTTSFALADSLAGAEAAMTTGGVGAALSAARMFNVGSTFLSGYGQLAEGKAKAKEAQFEADQLAQKKNQNMAAAENDMLIQKRQEDMAISRATNVAAAGGGALDPSVVNILGDLETQGYMNKQNTLWNAQVRANDNENDAIAKRFEGKEALQAGKIGAVASLFKGVSSMSDKYGPGGYG